MKVKANLTHIDSFSSARSRVRFLLEIFEFDTPRGLSDASGVSVHTIKSILRRDSIGPKTARKIAKALGIDYNWLRNGEGVPPLPGACHRMHALQDQRAGDSKEEFSHHPGVRSHSVRQRLRLLVEVHGLSGLPGMAQVTGVSLDRLAEILSSDTINDFDADQIAAALHISREWLKTGESGTQNSCMEPSGMAGTPLEDAALAARQGLPESPQAGDSFVLIPKMSARLSEGGGIIPDSTSGSARYAFRCEWVRSMGLEQGKLILVDVEGDSMAPTLHDGATALIDLNRQMLTDGRIYAIAVSEALQIKRLQLITGGRIRVISDNPAYCTYEAVPGEIRIIGQVIWFCHMAIPTGSPEAW